MTVKVINVQTGKVDRMWTRLYMDALNNDKFVQLPKTHRLTASTEKRKTYQYRN